MKMFWSREFLLLLIILVIQQSRFSSVELTFNRNSSTEEILNSKIEQTKGGFFLRLILFLFYEFSIAVESLKIHGQSLQAGEEYKNSTVKSKSKIKL
jgi:hypothetical protein